MVLHVTNDISRLLIFTILYNEKQLAYYTLKFKMNKISGNTFV